MTTISTNSQPVAIAAQLAEINEAIAWHYSQISILKAKANALNSISALPNEILSKIFVEFAFLSGRPFDLKWTKVMRVCRRWHDIALGEQQLWGYIRDSFSSHSERIRCQLERSGAAPLTVDIMSGDSGFHSSLFLRHAERLRNLSFIGSGIDVLEFMNSLSHHSLPLLRAMKLDPSTKLEEVPADVPRSFPDALFDGRAPYLTELDLTQIPINWSLLRGFTRLCLVKTPDTNQSDTFVKFLSLLEASPALRYLKLGKLISSNALTQSHPAVSLPYLELIWVQEDVALCTELLRRIIIPPTTRICLYVFGINNGADIAPLLVPARNHVRAQGAPVLRCLRLDATPLRGMHTSFMVSAFIATTAPNALEYDAANFLVNSHPTTEPALRGIMTKVLKALPCSTITHLDCRNAVHLTVPTWKAAVALLPALEMVYTWLNPAAAQFLTALAELTENPRNAVVPPLQHVHLWAYAWRQNQNEPDEVGPVLAALRRLLAARHACGTPLPVLEIDEQINSLNMEEAEWEALFEKVGKFIRNGNVYDPPAQRRRYEELRRQWQAEHPNYDDSE
ncbi:hypothetical protein DFH08DRAFT_103868 [Mycena albidolilacea]|uniref:F-box domain-containing protein n=1 Tax=Mycena albidolilacea TaxID=1033008 RepID=A0AAD6YYQ1_9AGAR|nr:hypothetical protein DFH08DRAFT_103868 [Mycena albidolilacea]